MFKKRTLSTQINLSFLVIMLLTLVSTIIVGVLFLLGAQYFAYPANHFDLQVPSALDYANEHSSDLLLGEGLDELEKIFNSNEVKVTVVSFNRNEVYGYDEGSSKEQLVRKLNMVLSDGDGNYTRYVPLLNEDGSLGGCFILTYPLRMMPLENRQLLYFSVCLALVCSPFIFLTLYMWLIGRRLKSNILTPLNKLKFASEKIENQDLDFELSYEYDNEFKDVMTSFEQMRKTLKQSLLQQWESEHQQKEYISALAHDLRSPLTVMKGHIELLQDGAYHYEDRCLKYLDVLDQATNRSIGLVEDLNLLSQFEQMTVVLNKECVLVRDYLIHQLSGYEIMAIVQNVQLIIDVETIDAHVEGMFDAKCISRVLDNLLMNALRYAPDSSRLIICAQVQQGILYLSVADEGKGFSEDDLKNGFKKFYRGDTARSKDGGSGLGLYICQRIIALHGGEIRLSNALHGGAVVSLDLPL